MFVMTNPLILVHLLLTSLPFKLVRQFRLRQGLRQWVVERRSVPRLQSEAQFFEQAF